MDRLADRVMRRYVAFKYQPKETKEHKVDRLTKVLRDETGLSRGVSESIVDAYVRGREVDRLAIQKGWPLSGDRITGPTGSMTLDELGKHLNQGADD